MFTQTALHIRQSRAGEGEHAICLTLTRARAGAWMSRKAEEDRTAAGLG